MTTDRSTKALLFAIALGLWLHLVADFARPTPVQAQGYLDQLQNSRVASDIANISSDTSAMRSSLKSIDTSLALRAAR